MPRTRPTALDLLATMLAVAAIWHYGWESLPPTLAGLSGYGYNVLFGVAALACASAARRLGATNAPRDAVTWRLMGAGLALVLAAQAVGILFRGAWVPVVADVLALCFYPAVIVAFRRQTPRPHRPGARRGAALDLSLVFVSALTVMLALQLRAAGVEEWALLPEYVYRTLVPALSLVAVSVVAIWYGDSGAARGGTLRRTGAAVIWMAIGDFVLNITPGAWDRWSNASWAVGAWFFVVAAQRAVPDPYPARSVPAIDGSTSGLIPMITAGALLLTLFLLLLASGGPESIVLSIGGALVTVLVLARHLEAVRLSSALAAAQALQEQRMHEAERLDALGRMARGVAHDFNGMLTAILGNADFALGLNPSSAEVRESLAQVRESALTAAGITRQLLDFARTGAVEPIAVDVRAVVRAQWRVLVAALPSTIRAELRADADPLTIRIGEGFVEQILHNLVTNARDAMPRGGALHVDVRGSASAVTIRVSDSGVGMSEETRQRIFEPFFSTKGRAGTGLGMATVYEIVRQSRGAIRVESTIGRGSSFELDFPRVDR